MKIEEFYEDRAQAKNPQKSIKCLEDDRWAKIKKCIDKYGKGLKILDVGCGNGWQTSFYLEGNEVWGLDISESNVKQAGERGIKALKHDIETPLPFEQETFDIVVCSEVLEHLFYPEKLMEEMNKVLKPRGGAIVSVPNLYCLGNRMAMLCGRKSMLIEYPFNKEHIRHYSIRGMKKLLEVNGFKVHSVYGTSFIMNLLDLNIFSVLLIGVPYLIFGIPFLFFSLLFHIVKFNIDVKRIVLFGNFCYMSILGKLLPNLSPGIIFNASKM